VSIVSRSSVLGTTSAKAEFVGAKTVKGPTEEITLAKPASSITFNNIERSGSAIARSAIVPGVSSVAGASVASVARTA